MCVSIISTSSNLPKVDSDTNVTFDNSTASAAAAAPAAAAADDMISICEHPDYAPFFKLLKVGVPDPVVRAKLGKHHTHNTYIGRTSPHVDLTLYVNLVQHNTSYVFFLAW